MKLLILGGTQFVGRHLTQAALDAGHEVTLFNRGKTNIDLFPEVEKLVGDRDGGLDALKGHSWDTVIDVNGYVPRLVRDSAELLKDAVGQYIFVSTISVYAEFDKAIDEDSKVIELEDPTVEEITEETYGGLKVLCERVVQEIYGEEALIVRPGYVIGPHDHTDRFSYWVWRAAQGGAMLSPGGVDEIEQGIDGRDQAEWIVRMVEKKNAGIFNSVANPFKFSVVMEKAKAISDSDTEFVWISEEFAKEHELLGQKLPMWDPGEEYAGARNVSNARAVAAGMTFRSIEEVTADTLAWIQERDAAGYEWKTGFKEAGEEAELIEKWNAIK